MVNDRRFNTAASAAARLVAAAAASPTETPDRCAGGNARHSSGMEAKTDLL